MMEKILVPVDGSENSKKGLRYACCLGRQIGSTIIVLYVVNIPYTGESAVLNIRSLISAGRRVLEEAKKIADEEKCTQTRYYLRQGISNPRP